MSGKERGGVEEEVILRCCKISLHVELGGLSLCEAKLYKTQLLA